MHEVCTHALWVFCVSYTIIKVKGMRNLVLISWNLVVHEAAAVHGYRRGPDKCLIKQPPNVCDNYVDKPDK